MGEVKRAHLFISGRVQGVTFRASTRRKARSLGLNGWVKNLSGGRVEAVFEGSKDKIEQIIDWCHKGPSAAHVTDVEVNWEETQNLSGFRIRY